MNDFVADVFQILDAATRYRALRKHVAETVKVNEGVVNLKRLVRWQRLAGAIGDAIKFCAINAEELAFLVTRGFKDICPTGQGRDFRFAAAVRLPRKARANKLIAVFGGLRGVAFEAQ